MSHFKTENTIQIKPLKQTLLLFHDYCMNELFSSFEIRYSTIFYVSLAVYTGTGSVTKNKPTVFQFATG